MNYEKIYNQIIERGRVRKLEGYIERHHIIPKCLGGTNDSENIVKLTAKEHFICHKLLTEIYPNETVLHYAVRMMANMKDMYGRTYNVGACEYQRLKENIVVSEETRKKSSESKQGIPKSAAHRKKLSESAIGRVGYWKNKHHSNDHRINLSKSREGYTHSEETKQKIGKSGIGKIISKSTREKLKISNSKKVYQYSIDGIFIKEWESGNIVAKELKINRSGISSCITGKLKQSGKYIWK